VLAPDFIGYGSSGPWPADQPFKSYADLDVLTAIAKKTKGSLHLVGHSYGAALTLEAARRLSCRVKSLTLVEPVLFHPLRQAAPTLLIKGGKTRAPARAVVDLLGETMPNAKVETLPGAGHMIPLTHHQAQPVDTRSPRGSALTGTPSPSPSSSTSRANNSSSSFAWDMALARTFSRSV